MAAKGQNSVKEGNHPLFAYKSWLDLLRSTDINSDQVFQQQESELQGELCNNDEQEDVVVGPVGLDGSEPHLMSCSNDNELSAM